MTENKSTTEKNYSRQAIPIPRQLYDQTANDRAQYRASRGNIRDNILGPAAVGAILGSIFGIVTTGIIQVINNEAGVTLAPYVEGGFILAGAIWGIVQKP